MDYRHEWKHVISYTDMLVLRQRLKAIMQVDRNAVDGKYFIRSLYFDTPTDTDLREKLDGVSRREKFRIRYYNHNTSRISEYAIKGRAYKSFKQYVLFEYAARGISVLEGFSYGNLYYILSVVREDDVKEAIAWKSKEQVKSTEVFIADIQHDLEYDNYIKELFVKYPDKS